MTTEPWMLDASCRRMNPDLWFPARGAHMADTAAAKAVCATCPVRDDCLDYAQREQIHHGIWGGYAPKERLALRRRRRLRQPGMKAS